jgi:excisionase family DNA binding protein
MPHNATEPKRDSIERLLTASDVAEMLSIKISTVYEWASSGILPSYSLHQGNRKTVRRFSHDEIESWLEHRKNRVKPAL